MKTFQEIYYVARYIWMGILLKKLFQYNLTLTFASYSDNCIDLIIFIMKDMKSPFQDEKNDTKYVIVANIIL